tara:strand:+ start:5463 stop:5900 length:438 start_codon:yes stop_codon:yes gene_type:complete
VSEVVGMEQRIVITDLLQMSHPGYRLIKNGRVITERELPTLLDYSTLVYERFKFYVNRDSYDNLKYSSFLSDIVDALKTLSEEDDPFKVFPVRDELRSLIPLFEDECKRMGKCFTNPPFVRTFYTELSDAISQAANEIMGEGEPI